MAVEGAPSLQQLEKLNAVELKKLLTKSGLPVSGKREILIRRVFLSSRTEQELSAVLGEVTAGSSKKDLIEKLVHMADIEEKLLALKTNPDECGETEDYEASLGGDDDLEGCIDEAQFVVIDDVEEEEPGDANVEEAGDLHELEKDGANLGTGSGLTSGTEMAANKKNGVDQDEASKVADTADDKKSGKPTEESKPKEDKPKEKKLTFCSVCNMYCTSTEAYQSHIKGPIHKERLEQKKNPIPADASSTSKMKTNNGDTEKKAKSIKCYLCDTSFRGYAVLKKHLVGHDHIKMLRAASGKEKKIVDIKFNIDMYQHPQPLLGLEYIIERVLDMSNVIIVYGCKLCGSQKISERDIFPHIKGLRHRLNYLEKNNPDVYKKAMEEPETSRGPFVLKHATQIEKDKGRGKVTNLQLVRSSVAGDALKRRDSKFGDRSSRSNLNRGNQLPGRRDERQKNRRDDRRDSGRGRGPEHDRMDNRRSDRMSPRGRDMRGRNPAQIQMMEKAMTGMNMQPGMNMGMMNEQAMMNQAMMNKNMSMMNQGMGVNMGMMNQGMGMGNNPGMMGQGMGMGGSNGAMMNQMMGMGANNQAMINEGMASNQAMMKMMNQGMGMAMQGNMAMGANMAANREQAAMAQQNRMNVGKGGMSRQDERGLMEQRGRMNVDRMDVGGERGRDRDRGRMGDRDGSRMTEERSDRRGRKRTYEEEEYDSGREHTKKLVASAIGSELDEGDRDIRHRLSGMISGMSDRDAELLLQITDSVARKQLKKIKKVSDRPGSARRGSSREDFGKSDSPRLGTFGRTGRKQSPEQRRQMAVQHDMGGRGQHFPDHQDVGGRELQQTGHRDVSGRGQQQGGIGVMSGRSQQQGGRQNMGGRGQQQGGRGSPKKGGGMRKQQSSFRDRLNLNEQAQMGGNTRHQLSAGMEANFGRQDREKFDLAGARAGDTSGQFGLGMGIGMTGMNQSMPDVGSGSSRFLMGDLGSQQSGAGGRFSLLGNSSLLGNVPASDSRVFEQSGNRFLQGLSGGGSGLLSYSNNSNDMLGLSSQSSRMPSQGLLGNFGMASLGSEGRSSTFDSFGGRLGDRF